LRAQAPTKSGATTVASAACTARCKRAASVSTSNLGGRRDAVSEGPPAGQERYVAGAAADVEHAHVRPDAGRAQHLLRQLAEEPALSDELFVVVAESVIVRGTVAHRPEFPRTGQPRLVPSDAVVR
jgi:hypothetical protein